MMENKREFLHILKKWKNLWRQSERSAELSFLVIIYYLKGQLIYDNNGKSTLPIILKNLHLFISIFVHYLNLWKGFFQMIYHEFYCVLIYKKYPWKTF